MFTRRGSGGWGKEKPESQRDLWGASRRELGLYEARSDTRHPFEDASASIVPHFTSRLLINLQCYNPEFPIDHVTSSRIRLWMVYMAAGNRVI